MNRTEAMNEKLNMLRMMCQSLLDPGMSSGEALAFDRGNLSDEELAIIARKNREKKPMLIQEIRALWEEIKTLYPDELQEWHLHVRQDLQQKIELSIQGKDGNTPIGVMAPYYKDAGIRLEKMMNDELDDRELDMLFTGIPYL